MHAHFHVFPIINSAVLQSCAFWRLIWMLLGDSYGKISLLYCFVLKPDSYRTKRAEANKCFIEQTATIEARSN